LGSLTSRHTAAPLPVVVIGPVATAVALMSAAWWVRAPGMTYLAVCAIATVIAAAAAWRGPARAERVWTRLAALALAAFCAVATAELAAVLRMARDWPSVSAETVRVSAAAMGDALTETARSLEQSAQVALDAPPARSSAFAALQAGPAGHAERSIVLYRGDSSDHPFAWAGVQRTPIDTSAGRFAVLRTPFYLALQAIARRGRDRAVATALIHADPPADRLSSPLDERVSARTSVRGFSFANPENAGPGDSAILFAPGGAGDSPLLAFRPDTPRQPEATLRTTERAQRRGALVVALALALFLAGEWRPRRAAPLRRVMVLAVALAILAVLPLNAFSNAAQLFDPTYYFSTFGGPYTASVGALALAGAVLVLAALAAARPRLRLRPRVVAAVIAGGLAVAAPFAISHLADGITPPGAGVPLTIWLGWQLALALVGTALLVVAGAAGRGAVARGPAPLVGVLIAAAAAAAGPFVWRALGHWPAWYAATWCIGAAAIAVARTTKWRVFAPAIVAGLGSALLVWATTAEKRIMLAQQDVAGLDAPDPDAEALLDRFAQEIATSRPAMTRADLLKLYARSELASANYPVALAVWMGDEGQEAPAAELALARFSTDVRSVAAAVSAARRLDSAVLTEAVGSPGVQLVLAVPRAPTTEGGLWSVTTVVVAPQTRLITESSVATLLGLAADTGGTPLYTISLIEGTDAQPVRADASLRWIRIGSTLHGDWLVRGVNGPARAHVEIELRPFDALAERAVLLLVVDLLAIAALWSLSAVGDGALWRWLRGRLRVWRRSYRTQLTLVLFAFFVTPTAVFAVWSERRLRADDVQARSLRVAETLRSVVAENELDRLMTAEQRLGVPLLLYDQGALSAASDTLYAEVAPLGLLLRPDIELALGVGDEVVASRTAWLAGVRTLVGYRAATQERRHVVLAAPEGADEIALDLRSSDLSVLVLFTTVLGATAALWLSGVAARQLARPIDELRRAALAMAAGEREPPLAGDPPAEFVPVFSAFRRMAADFGASQRVLAWGEMARQVAHEIKNPLTPIRLGVQHLLRARADKRVDFERVLRQNAGRILAEIDRLDEIARNFSRYGTAPAERPPAEATDVAAVARDVVELERMGGGAAASAAGHSDGAGGGGGEVHWELTGGDNAIIARARADELREVLLNVLENARLAHARHVAVRLGATASRDSTPGRVTLTIQDDGEGIPADVLSRVFEPHFSTRTSGSGLGLALSRRIVDGWGGSIGVASERGRGTRVTISLLLIA
jgi:two-component system nitrogen regulation sensor histidine kinase NtrY